jgi:solute carrier family 35 protein E3
MAERSSERDPSIGRGENETFNEKRSSRDSSEGSYAVKTPEEMEMGDEVERDRLLQEEDSQKTVSTPPPSEGTTRSAVIWMVVNTLATIGIVRAAYLYLETYN